MFNIEVRFLGGLTSSQQLIFQRAAERWLQILRELFLAFVLMEK